MHQGRRLEEDGVWEPIATRRGLHRAHRAWHLAGGPKAVEREQGRARDIELTRQAAETAEHMRALGIRVSAELERMASVRRVMAWSRGCVQRRLHNLQVAAGLRQDGRQRWAVDEIVEWGTGGLRGRALSTLTSCKLHLMCYR